MFRCGWLNFSALGFSLFGTGFGTDIGFLLESIKYKVGSMKKSANTRFEDSSVWNDSINLATEVYKLTKSFPADELYAMTSQMRRASASVSANIAEGYGRVTKKDKTHFYTMAYGSLMEVKSFLYLSQKVGFCEHIDDQLGIIDQIQDQINAIRGSLK